MATSRIPTTNYQAQSEMYPWRRGPYMFAEPTNVAPVMKTLNKPLSVEAAEFVPRWAREEGKTASQTGDGNCYLISLDGYSDDDSEPEFPTRPVSKASPPAAASSAASQKASDTTKGGKTLAGRDTDEPSTAPSSRPWRAPASASAVQATEVETSSTSMMATEAPTPKPVQTSTSAGQKVATKPGWKSVSAGQDETYKGAPRAKINLKSIFAEQQKASEVAPAEKKPAWKSDTVDEQKTAETAAAKKPAWKSVSVEEKTVTATASKKPAWKSAAMEQKKTSETAPAAKEPTSKSEETRETATASRLPPWKRAGRPIWKPPGADVGEETSSEIPAASSSNSKPDAAVKTPISTATTDVDTGASRTESDATLSEDGSASCDDHDDKKIIKQKVPTEKEENESSTSTCGSEPEPEADVAIFKVSDLLMWRSSVDMLEEHSHEVPGKLIARAEQKAEPKAEASIPEASTPMASSSKAMRPSAAASPTAASKSETSGSWRNDAAARVKAEDRPEKRSAAPAKGESSNKLQVSETSWAAKMRERRSQQAAGAERTDEEVVRAMKSILNKLTLEKFSQLYQQMISCGIRTADHLEQLIQEVFEKATTQHHFIDMYADLCAQLHEHFQQNPITDNGNMTFKKILLNACQASFEKNLSPPADLASMSPEEKAEAEFAYKMRMIGNIRLVGALLVRKMLASKVMLAIIEELLSDPTAEALETLAALLTVVGGEFDTPTFVHRVALNAIFCQVQNLVKKSSTPPRVRCLLKDVLDLRKSGWLDKKPKKAEKPTTLDQVHQKAAEEDGTPVASSAFKAMARKIESSAPARVNAPSAAPKETPKEEIKAARKDEPKQQVFDQDSCRAEVGRALKELFVSHDLDEAVSRVADAGFPATHQAAELNNILSLTSEEGSAENRKVGFKFVAGLFLKGHWKKAGLVDGLCTFIGETCADLKYDIPALPKIVNQELHSAFTPLVEAGIMKQAQHKVLATATF